MPKRTKSSCHETERQAITREVLARHTVVRAAGQIPLLCPKVFHPYAPLPRPKYHLAVRPTASTLGNTKNALPPIQSYQDYHVTTCTSCQCHAVTIFRNEMLRVVSDECSGRADIAREEYGELRSAIAACGPSPAAREQLRTLREIEVDQRKVHERNAFFYFESLHHVWRSAPQLDAAVIAGRAEKLMHRAACTTKEQSKRLVARVAKWEQEIGSSFAAAIAALLDEEIAARRDAVMQWLNATARLLQLYRADESTATRSIRKRFEVERARQFARVVGSDVIQAGRTVIESEEAEGWSSVQMKSILSLAEVRKTIFAQRVHDFAAKETASRERSIDRSMKWINEACCDFLVQLEELARPEIAERASQSWSAFTAEYKTSQLGLVDMAYHYAARVNAKLVVSEAVAVALGEVVCDGELAERTVIEHEAHLEERRLWDSHPKFGRVMAPPSPRQATAFRQLSRKEATERAAIAEVEGAHRGAVYEGISETACASSIASSVVQSSFESLATSMSM